MHLRFKIGSHYQVRLSIIYFLKKVKITALLYTYYIVLGNYIDVCV
jgi:hypothetical protein